MSANIPNAFIQAKVPKKMKGKDPNKKIVMKITGKLVDMLVAMAPEIYGSFVVYKKRKESALRYCFASAIWHAYLSNALVQ